MYHAWGNENAYKIMVDEPQERPLGRSRRRRKERDFVEVGCEI